MNILTAPYNIYKAVKPIIKGVDDVSDVATVGRKTKVPSWQNIDWMTPTKYDDEEGINLLKSIYKYVDWENMKLGDEVTHTPIMTVSSLGNVVKAGGNRSTILPPKNFMEVLEKVRLGEINQVEAAKILGMHEVRPTRPLKSGEPGHRQSTPFTRIWNMFIDKYPHPDELLSGVSARGRESEVMSVAKANKLLNKASKGDDSDPLMPFEVRLYNAYKEDLGIPFGISMEDAGKTGWNPFSKIAAQVYGSNVNLTPGRYDIYTGKYMPSSAKKPKAEAYAEAKDGDILTWTARDYARAKDYPRQRRVLEEEIQTDPEAEWMFNWLKEHDGSRYFDVDHVQATMFNGAGDSSNLRVTLKGAHGGKVLEPHMSSVGEIVTMKSKFDTTVYEQYKKIIDIFDPNNKKTKNLSMAKKEEMAAGMAKEIETLANNFKKANPNTDFIVSDPWVYVKNSKAEKGFDKMTYAEKILPKGLQKIANRFIVRHENLPNKGDNLNVSLKKAWERIYGIYEASGGKLPKKVNLPGFKVVKDADGKTKVISDPSTSYKGALANITGEFEEGGLVRPHMSYGGDMAQFTEMESVVPELNPAEAGMEDYTQLAMSIPKFRNPFKKVDPPPIMSDAVSGIKIADKTKKGAKIEGTIRTEGQTPVFHLKSDLEIAGAVQDKMTPQQWNGYLLKKGVSETEMHEFGLGNLLKNIGGFDEGTKKWKNNAPITKADLIAQYKNNKPVISYKIQQIEPFEKGWKDFQSFLTGQKRGGSGYLGDLPSGARELEELRQLKNKPQDIIGDRLRSNIIKFSQEISDRTGRDIKSAWAELDPQITANINGIIKEAYGIENVVENGFGNVKVPFYTQNLVNRFRRLKKGEGFYMGKTGVGHEGAQFLKGGTGYIEIPFTYNPNPKGMRANEPRFKFGEGHFTNPKGNNPVFWLRASERVDERGKRVFLIEEIQSDMHQKPKQKPDTFSYAPRHDEPSFINKVPALDELETLKGDLVKVSDQIDKITGHTDPSAVTVMERLKVKRDTIRNRMDELQKLIKRAGKENDEIFPEGPWKKSENQAKIAIKTLINLATQEGFDSVAIISGKAKNHAVGASADIAKGNRGFYDNIAVSGMKNVAKNLDLEFSSTNIKDGDGNTWAKIPIINLKKEPVKASVDMYKAKGGYIHRPSFVDVVPVL